MTGREQIDTPQIEDLEEKIILGMFDRGLLGFPEGGIILKSGRNSPYYYNDRINLSFDRELAAEGRMSIAQQREFRQALAQGMGQKFLELEVDIDHVFGKAQAATAPAALGAYEAGLSYLWERVDEPNKIYGAHKKIEGSYHEGEKVGLGDDVVTDGKSKIEGASVLEEVGLIPVSVTIKFDREEGGMQVLEAHQFEVNAVTTLSRAIPVLRENDRISDQQVESIVAYHQQLREEGLTSTFTIT